MSRGRPRSVKVDQDIRTAVRELVAASGYGGLTIEAVADRAGVARTTVYRRHPSVAELILDAFADLVGSRSIPDTGSFASDVEFLALGLVRSLQRSADGPMTRAAVAAAAQAPDVFERAVRPVVAQRRDQVAEIVDRAVGRGEIDPEVGWSMVEMVIGAIYFRYLVSGDPLTPSVIRGWLRVIQQHSVA